MSRKRAKVIITEPERFAERAISILEQCGDVDLREVLPDNLHDAFKNYDVVWTRLRARVDAQVLKSAPRCRIIATPVTGLDQIDLKACRDLGIQVVSLKGETEFLREVRATAELTLALLLSLIRQIPAAARDVEEGQWRRGLFPGSELYGKRAGVVGMGRLGTIVAEYLDALGMQVSGWDVVPWRSKCTARAASLEELLSESDVVTLHVDLNETSHHLIDAKRLQLMKPTSVLVNTSRGGVVDEVALLKCLESRAIRGAAVDVISGEPNVDESHPMVRASARLGNLLLVPHLGGNTPESFEKTEVFIAERVVALWERISS